MAPERWHLRLTSGFHKHVHTSACPHTNTYPHTQTHTHIPTHTPTHTQTKHKTQSRHPSTGCFFHLSLWSTWAMNTVSLESREGQAGTLTSAFVTSNLNYSFSRLPSPRKSLGFTPFLSLGTGSAVACGNERAHPCNHLPKN